MAKNPLYNYTDLTTSASNDVKPMLVDKKLVDILMAQYGPSNLNAIKQQLCQLIVDAPTLDEMIPVVNRELYLIEVANHKNMPKEDTNEFKEAIVA